MGEYCFCGTEKTCTRPLLRVGQIVLTEATGKPISQWISRSTDSPWTHAFLVVRPNALVEAAFPRVRSYPLCRRMAELEYGKRAYAVLDLPGITFEQRRQLVDKALSYEGRRYDVVQAFLYAVTRKFWNDGPSQLVCSRLVTAAFYSGLGINLFPEEIIQNHPRRDNLIAGYATPDDLLHSRLDVVGFRPSTRVPTLGRKGR